MKRAVGCLIAIGKFLLVVAVIYIAILVLYPKTEFYLESLDAKTSYHPPARVLDTEEKYPYGFSTEFSAETISSYYQHTRTMFYTRKKCKTLYIREIKYEWEGKSGDFPRSRTSKIQMSSFPLEFEDNSWTSSEELNYQVDIVRCLPEFIDFYSLFIGKKVGDKFDFKLIFVFNVDDDPVISQTINYEVTVHKGELRFLRYMMP